MAREETFEKACLKMLSAIRTLKMMAGRFDRDSDRGKDNDDNHHGDNNHVSGHRIFLLEKLGSVSDFFARVNQVRDQSGNRQQDQPAQNTEDRGQIYMILEKDNDLSEVTHDIRFFRQNQ